MQTKTLERPSAASAPDAISAAVAANIVSVAARARIETMPFRHWRFTNLLPPDLCREIIKLPIAPVPIGDTYGKRDSHNDVRRFFSPDMQQQYPVIHTVAEAFQTPSAARAIEAMCGASLKDSYLRIEYCQDRDGFWLEPHMDIKEKHITMQLYLNTGPGAETLGTDLYDTDKKLFSSAPSQLGEGMLFVPKEPASWHGFEKRTIPDVRRSLIINYVTDDWRARHELAYPDQKIS